jgi:hypothetical protein
MTTSFNGTKTKEEGGEDASSQSVCRSFSQQEITKRRKALDKMTRYFHQ